MEETYLNAAEEFTIRMGAESLERTIAYMWKPSEICDRCKLTKEFTIHQVTEAAINEDDIFDEFQVKRNKGKN